MPRETHVSDEDLALALDGELSKPRAAEVNRHLAHCWACRARRGKLERAIEDYMEVHRSTASELVIPPAQGPAAVLRANLRQAAGSRQQQLSQPWSLLARPSLLAGALAILLTPFAIVFWFQMKGGDADAGPLPNSRLTPGEVRVISKRQVCSAAPEDEGRTVPAHLAQQVFAGYGIANPKPRSYEVDYLISPALGGASGLQNLWPVPYADGEWTSRVKDALEDHLHTLVCEDKLDLATAQHELATNWIAAYRKYFHTKKPIVSHALFVKDSPWE